MDLNSLHTISKTFKSTPKMPVLFFGHGSPMNAIENNEFTQGWRKSVQELPQKPNAILCISAHWETEGTFVTSMNQPRTIHDFYGFPQSLFEVEYPASGSPELALEVQKNITKTKINLDNTWGLDHGAWSVVKHLFPDANIPIIEMSLDYTKEIKYHFELGKELSFLREKGILIIGSGNLVHNLRTLNWNLSESGFDWAYEANKIIKYSILSENYSSLINYNTLGKEVLYSIPSLEHFLPSIYSIALRDKNETLSFFNDKVIMGSLSMTSFIIQ